MAILLVLFSAAFTIISFAWRNSIKKEFDVKIEEIKTVGSKVENDRKKVENDVVKIKDNRQELKQIKRDFDDNQNLLRESRNKFEGKIGDIKMFQPYVNFIEYKVLEAEAVNKYSLLRGESINTCSTIKDLIKGNAIINDHQVLLRIYKKIQPYVTDKDETIADIYNYYNNNLLKQEEAISEKVLKNMNFDRYLYLTDDGEDKEMESDLIGTIEDWQSYPEDIKVILSCIEAERILNSN